MPSASIDFWAAHKLDELWECDSHANTMVIFIAEGQQL